MGRGGRNTGQQPWSGGGNGLRVWPGAYSPQGPANKDRRPPWKGDGRGQQDFPSYSSIQLPQERAAPTGTTSGAADESGAMNTNSIQHALNATRKAETKVCRLKAAYQDLSVKMAAYEQKLKEALRRERARFAKDQERLLREIADAESAQDAARTGLRAAFAEERSAALGGYDVEMGDQDVDRTFEEWAREDSTAMDGVLRRALAPATGHALPPGSFTSPVRSNAAPKTPQPGPLPGGPVTPPATADPYLGMASPFHAPPGLVVSPHPGQNPVAPGLATGPAPGLVVNAPAAPLGPVETHIGSGLEGEPTGYGPSPTLGERVNRRRALEPFGGSARPPDPVPDNPERARGVSLEAVQAALAAGRTVRIVEDDNEDELADANTSEALS